MSEEEWYEVGFARLYDWREYNDPYPISELEASAFEYAWELAGREMGIVK